MDESAFLSWIAAHADGHLANTEDVQHVELAGVEGRPRTRHGRDPERRKINEFADSFFHPVELGNEGIGYCQAYVSDSLSLAAFSWKSRI